MRLKTLLLIIGILLLVGGLSLQCITSKQYIPYQEATQTATKSTNIPEQIAIPRIGINAEVKPGGIVNGRWILSDTYVHAMSLDGQQDNTILYAHERKGLFVNLKNIKNADNIFLAEKTGKIATYQVYSIERINPTDINKLHALPNSLTLYTCDGLFDQSRLLVKAKLLK